jgi:succinate dehydrogenase/fumarate reductase flavoprotein subunit
MTTPRPIEHDVLVLGTGAAGLTAAAVTAAGGADVGLYEKADAVGDTSAISAGVVWLPVQEVLARDVRVGGGALSADLGVRASA